MLLLLGDPRCSSSTLKPSAFPTPSPHLSPHYLQLRRTGQRLLQLHLEPALALVRPLQLHLHALQLRLLSLQLGLGSDDEGFEGQGEEEEGRLQKITAG